MRTKWFAKEVYCSAVTSFSFDVNAVNERHVLFFFLYSVNSLCFRNQRALLQKQNNNYMKTKKYKNYTRFFFERFVEQNVCWNKNEPFNKSF